MPGPNWDILISWSNAWQCKNCCFASKYIILSSFRIFWFSLPSSSNILYCGVWMLSISSLAVGIWCVTVPLKEPPICRGILSDTGTCLFHLQRQSLVWRADIPITQDHKICPRVLFLCTVRGTKAPELGTDPIGTRPPGCWMR